MSTREFNLNRWQNEMFVSRARIEALTLAHPGDKAPATGWNIAQCLQHLDVTAHAFIAQWRAAFLRNHPKPGAKYSFWWRWFLRNIEDTYKLRNKTSPQFDPANASKLEDATAAYFQTRENIMSLAEDMQQTQSGGIAIRSPFASWMKYPMDFSFDLVAAHERRHLTQAERI